jgi:hypothetical protein
MKVNARFGALRTVVMLHTMHQRISGADKPKHRPNEQDPNPHRFKDTPSGNRMNCPANSTKPVVTPYCKGNH